MHQLILSKASCGIEILAASSLGQADLPFHIINPCQVPEFARSTGKLGEIDNIYAALLTHLSQLLQPPLRPWLEAEQQ